jgi:hypothetical protein
MKSPTTMITMGIIFVVTLEVEVVELDLKYKKKQAMRRFENSNNHFTIGIQKWQNYLPLDH